jgi:hypothetical protein
MNRVYKVRESRVHGRTGDYFFENCFRLLPSGLRRKMFW